MSGHSHFKTIKRQKEISDNKRGQVFSKLSRTISLAAKEGGGNPETNSKLRMAIEEARSFNLPKENVERAIKRGTGELAGEKLETFAFEAFGPAGVAVVIEGITDNINRTLSEVKQVLNQNNGKLAGEGAVQWMFERKGVLTIQVTENKEEIELAAIEAGAEDVYWHDGLLDIYTKPEDLEKVKKNLEAKNMKTESATLGLVPKNAVAVNEKDKQSCQNLFEALDENDAVQEIYSNIED